MILENHKRQPLFIEMILQSEGSLRPGSGRVRAEPKLLLSCIDWVNVVELR